MAVHVYTTLCTRIITDIQTNLVSMIEIVEKINVDAAADEFRERMAQIPAGNVQGVSHEMGIASRWVRSDPAKPESGSVRLRVLMPDGAAREDWLNFGVDLEAGFGFRASGTVAGIPWGGFGLYWIAVEWRSDGEETWREMTRIPLELALKEPVVQLPPESGQAPAPPPEPKPAPSRKSKPTRRTRKNR